MAQERKIVTFLFIAGNAMLGGSSLQSPLQTGLPAGSGMQRNPPGRSVEKDLVVEAHSQLLTRRSFAVFITLLLVDPPIQHSAVAFNYTSISNK